MLGPHGFHAHLFKRVEYFLGFPPGWNAAGMQGFIMMAELQCRGICRAAQLGHFIGRQGAGW